MTRLISKILAFALLFSASASMAADTAPDALVRSVVDEVLGLIKQNSDKQTLRKLAEQKVLPYFDFKEMTQDAVGRAWRDATPAQQQALENGFRALLVNTYVSALSHSGSSERSVEVRPLPGHAGQKDVLVRTLVKEAGKPPLPIDYRMIATPAGWKVADVSVENVSLVTNYRGQFSDQVARSGIDGLIKTLDEKNRASVRS